MELNRNMTEFETYMHRIAWSLYIQTEAKRNLVPYMEISLQSSAQDAIDFFLEVYKEEFFNMGKYGLLPCEAPELSNEGMLHKKLPEQPYWILRSIIHNGELDEDGNIVIPCDVYHKKYIKPKFWANNPNYYDLLTGCGLYISENEDETVISNLKYPDMFRILIYVRDNKIDEWSWGGFRRLSDEIQCLCEVLSDKQQSVLFTLDEQLREMGFKRSKRLSVGRLVYKYNKEIMIYIQTVNCQLSVGVMFWNCPNSFLYDMITFEELCDKIDEFGYGEDLKKISFSNLKPCSFCNENGCNYFITYNGIHKRACRQRGGVYFEEFDQKSMKEFWQLADIRMKMLRLKQTP